MFSKPKLAVVSVSVPPSPTGQSRMLGHMLEGATPESCLLLSANPPTPNADAGELAFGTYYRLPPLPPSGPWPTRLAGISPRLARMAEPTLESARIAAGVRQEAQEIATAVRQFGAQVIVACTASPTNLPAAAMAAQINGLPFVAYLFDDPVYQWPPGTWRRFAAAQERRWGRQAAAVISPNEFMAEEFQRRRRRGAFIVRNPVADTALDHGNAPPPRDPASPLRIVYTGTLYHAQADAFINLLQALEALNGAAVLEVYTYQSVAEIATHGVAGPHLRVMPFVDQAGAYAVQRSADVLFLPLAFHSSIPEVISRSAPGKTGEYLAAGRPLLVHAPEASFVARHIRDHDAGLVVGRPEPAQLEAALRQMITGAPAVAVTVANALRLAEQYRSSVQRDAFWSVMRRVADGERVG